ncbi:MAG: glycoside hydrolase family 3 C-terminal domain-containing protein [bacterium]
MKDEFKPLTYEEADHKAESILALMTLDEKIALVGGERGFFIRPLPRLNLQEVYMTDATQGINIRKQFRDVDLSEYSLEQSTAFPCPLLLASTWNPGLCYQYAEAIGEECRAGGIGILLGPGMNSYRHAQCGRNFEYFGEDPFLRSRMIEAYVKGVQSTGTIATLKHFVANNTEFYRRKSNSIIDERTLHEIYLPPFKAGIDADAKAVMTAYNLLNGEWCGQSERVINNLLRTEIGFKWLVMTDWWSVDNGELLATSGQDLEMPYAAALNDAETLISEGSVTVEEINRMAGSILRTYFAMKLDERKREIPQPKMYEIHESVALQTAREGIVLLKNDGDILPLGEGTESILLTGEYVETLAAGSGSAAVKGYHNRLMLDELKKQFGERIFYRKNPTPEQIRSAEIVLCNVGTIDSEGWDRPFELPAEQENRVNVCVENNPNTIVIVTSGGGIRMTNWHDKVKALIYAWYGGQVGNKALAEIITGITNPSGKLPITIEREFSDSPAYGYIPDGEVLYTGWHDEEEKVHPVYDIHYHEGVFVGYRWYEKNNIEPLYPFGHGLSYTTFDYSDLAVSKETFHASDILTVSLTVTNSGRTKGLETVQLYVQDSECSHPRPIKELKGFAKVELEAGESKSISFELDQTAFSFWNPEAKNWTAELGKFVLHIGSSLQNLMLNKEIEIL